MFKEKYYELYKNCLDICDRIDNHLLNNFDDLNKNLRDTILVDNELVDNEKFFDLERQISTVYNDIKAYEQVIVSKFQ